MAVRKTCEGLRRKGGKRVSVASSGVCLPSRVCSFRGAQILDADHRCFEPFLAPSPALSPVVEAHDAEVVHHRLGLRLARTPRSVGTPVFSRSQGQMVSTDLSLLSAGSTLVVSVIGRASFRKRTFVIAGISWRRTWRQRRRMPRRSAITRGPRPQQLLSALAVAGGCDASAQNTCPLSPRLAKASPRFQRVFRIRLQTLATSTTF